VYSILPILINNKFCPFLPADTRGITRSLQKNLTKSPNYDKKSFILLGFALPLSEPPNGLIPGSKNPKRKTTFTRRS
jgi:hypothetical protein